MMTRTKIRPEEITVVRGCDITGRSCWHLVRANHQKSVLLSKQAEAGRVMDVSARGEILESGYGEYPDSATIARYLKP
jgi:hypothetical protein